MGERPILFSSAMVRAILADAKTQTRRVVKLPRWAEPGTLEEGADGVLAVARVSGCLADVSCPYGAPGDDLWVRETWARRVDVDPEKDAEKARHYLRFAADSDDLNSEWHDYGERWRPSIHMPRWASRITLRVTSVRVERLHAISEDDARAEGAPKAFTVSDGGDSSHRAGFRNLWRELHGAESWDANPWVWALGFDRVDP